MDTDYLQNRLEELTVERDRLLNVANEAERRVHMFNGAIEMIKELLALGVPANGKVDEKELVKE